jgi:uncharacterized protein YdaU (DUF1376 family)
MPFYCHDYMRDERVIDMTPVGRSVYVELLCSSWSMGGSLPNRPDHLWKYTLLNTKEEWDAVASEVLSMFKVVEDRLVNPRLSEEFKQSLKIAKDRINAGKLGAEARYGTGTATGTASSGANGATNASGVEHYITGHYRTLQDNKTITVSAAADLSSAPSDSQTPASASGPSSGANRVAVTLIAILGRNDLKPGTRVAWAEQAETLVTKYGEEKVMQVMQKLLAENRDGFWRGRVMAMKSLVKCFTTMHSQFVRDAGTGRKAAAADPLAARAASLHAGHDFTAMAKGDV